MMCQKLLDRESGELEMQASPTETEKCVPCQTVAFSLGLIVDVRCKMYFVAHYKLKKNCPVS